MQRKGCMHGERTEKDQHVCTAFLVVGCCGACSPFGICLTRLAMILTFLIQFIHIAIEVYGVVQSQRACAML